MQYRTREQIDTFLWENHRKYKYPEYWFGVDNNQDPPELFQTAKVRVLVAFLSSGSTRSVSNTFNILYTLLKQALGEDVFVDFCYYQERDVDYEFEAKGFPTLFGNVSHAHGLDYDVVLVSQSVVAETFNMPHLLHRAGIPLSHEERLETDCPLLVYGGAASNQCSILFGETGTGGRSLVDLAMFGHVEETLPTVMREIGAFAEQVESLRTHKRELIEHLIDHSAVQEYIYFPNRYLYHYREDNFTIERIERLDPRVPEKVKFSHITDRDFPGFLHKTFVLDGSNSRRQNLQISAGCSGEGTCSFCMEGTVSGGWREKALPKLVEDMERTKQMSAPTTLGFYSYNLNYYSQVLDLLKHASHHAKILTMNNMRTDVIASSPEYLELSKKLGLVRIGMAVEGMGERMRNQVLNKNLSRAQLMQAVKNVFDRRFFVLKLGMIFTGLETEEDIQEWLSEVDEIMALRESTGAKTSISIVHTPLVIYDQTPLRWYPRATAWMSYSGERTMYHYLGDLRKRGVKVSFHSRGPGTYIEQLLLDLGPAGTPLLVDAAIQEGVRYFRHYGDLDKEAVHRAAKRAQINVELIFKERPADFIFPSDILEFVPEARVQKWRKQYEAQDFRHEICLRTTAHTEGKCFACGFCATKEDVASITERSLESENTVEDVVASFDRIRHVSSTRFVVQLDPKWSLFNKKALSHYITSLFLRRSQDLTDAFYALGRDTTFWASDSGQKGWFGGMFAFEVEWKDRIQRKHIEPFLEDVNAELRTAKVLRFDTEAKDFPITFRQQVSYVGSLGCFSMTEIRDAVLDFDWQIHMPIKSMGDDLFFEDKYMPEIKDQILFVPHRNQVLSYMYLPIKLSPYMVLLSLFPTTKYQKILAGSRFNVVDHAVDLQVTCSCGRPLTHSLFTGSPSRKCPVCAGKKHLYHLTQK